MKTGCEDRDVRMSDLGVLKGGGAPEGVEGVLGCSGRGQDGRSAVEDSGLASGHQS